MRKDFNFGTRKFAKNVEVSNDMRVSGKNNHDMIIGSTRSGKSGGYIFQNLKNPIGSYVVSDTKGRLCLMFRPYLESLGYEVKTVDFINPENSIGYNPLSYIRRNADDSINERDVKKFVVSISPILDSSEPFWELSAQRYVSMLIGYVLEALTPEERNMVSVVRLHRMCQFGEGKKILEDWANEYPDTFSAGKFKEMFPSSSAEKMWNSIMEFANQILEPFSYKEFNTLFSSTESIDIKSIGMRKTVLFINSSDNDPAFHVLANMLVTQIMQTLIEVADKNLEGCLEVPVRLILDDFAAGPKIDNFDNLISIIASREISVSIILQSISQLTNKYSKESADTIINNCDHILYLSGHDKSTADFLSIYLNKSSHTILSKACDQAILITDGEGASFVPKFIPYDGIEELEKFSKDISVEKVSNTKCVSDAPVSETATMDVVSILNDIRKAYKEKYYPVTASLDDRILLHDKRIEDEEMEYQMQVMNDALCRSEEYMWDNYDEDLYDEDLYEVDDTVCHQYQEDNDNNDN